MERSESSIVNKPSEFVANSFARNEAHSSGLSWPAVIAGAFATAALSLILLALGTGMGLSTGSPRSDIGTSASTVIKAGIVWFIIIQIVASAIGGYLAGRLRTKWATIHTEEVYFRDTVHGFLVWAVGLVVTAAFFTSIGTSMISGAAQRTATTSVSDGSGTMPGDDANAYFIDTLFRSDSPTPDRTDAELSAETRLIFANALRQGNLPEGDRAYLAKLAATKTGLAETEAEERVSEVFEKVQRSAEIAHRARANLSLWIFIALLIGAFCASYAATIGGRQRDHVKLI